MHSTERLLRHAAEDAQMATISHELRTPLNVIIGYTDMQLDGAFGDLNPEHASTLRTVREQAMRLLALIQIRRIRRARRSASTPYSARVRR